MAGTSKIAYLLERLMQGINAHDRENPGHHTWGVGMAHFDIERLGSRRVRRSFPASSSRLTAASPVRSASSATVTTTRKTEAEAEEVVEAIADERELEIASPGWSGTPPPLRPPV